MRPQGKIADVITSFQKCYKGILFHIRPADLEVLYKWAKVFERSNQRVVFARREMILNRLRGCDYAIDDRRNPVLSLTSEFSSRCVFFKNSPIMDAMCNKHEIHIAFVLAVVDSDLENLPLQL